MVSHPPSSLIATRLGELAKQLPAVRTADVEAVHSARVLTRRLRELLRLTRNSNRDITGEAADRLRAAGRALGKVRELDVLEALVAGLEPRARFAAATLSDLRHDVERGQRDARRRMFKTLEGLDLTALAVDRSFTRPMSRVSIRPSQLRRHIGVRSAAVLQCLQRAAGVYMPNRSHKARIAIKKLRYAVEVAAETAVWGPPELLKDLRRAQSLLGDMHDRQILIDRLESLSSESDRRTEETGWLIDLVRAEIEDAHGTFLRRLPSLESAAAVCERWSARGMSWDRRLGFMLRCVAASSVLVPSIQRAVDVVRAGAEEKRSALTPSAGEFRPAARS
jgi:CHAD domain-containing protein